MPVILNHTPGGKRVPREQFCQKLPLLDAKLLGKYDLAIVAMECCVLMVLDMTRTEPDMVPPTKKSENCQKEIIQRTGFKDCSVG